jgi:cytochrome d ubiquinol oxidase subunit II
MFPFIMPSSTDPASSLIVWDATSSLLTLRWMFGATVIFLPLIILYTSWVYSKMRGPIELEAIENDQGSLY